MKYRVTYTVPVIGSAADGDCHDGEQFRGLVVESVQFESDSGNEALETAKLVIAAEDGDLVSLVPIR